MKIYTKKGDNGSTQLIGGTRIKKNNERIDSYGTVDELNSYIGLLRDNISNNLLKFKYFKHFGLFKANFIKSGSGICTPESVTTLGGLKRKN